jgi:hypothetical protein
MAMKKDRICKVDSNKSLLSDVQKDSLFTNYP